MARPKKTSSEELVGLVDSYFTTEAVGNPAKLKCSLLEAYAVRNGIEARAIRGENDLLTINPNLALEWDYEKNKNLTPDEVMGGSQKKVWWKCREGHSWKAAVYSRKNNGCPYCSGRKVLSGINDLVTLNPEIASEWDYDKNGELLPEETSVQSNREIWWKCKKGHSWRAAVCDRYNSNGCPVCSGRLRMRTHFVS